MKSNADIYGYLYNWYAVNDTRMIAPEGWHVPTDEDWKELEKYLGIHPNDLNNIGYRGENQGDMLKQSNNEYWKQEGSEGNNRSGFSALPAGFRDEFSGNFSDIKCNTVFWTSDEYDRNRAWVRYIKGQFPQIYRYYYPKNGGLSIRCVRDKF